MVKELNEIPKAVYQKVYGHLVNERNIYKAKYLQAKEALEWIYNHINDPTRTTVISLDTISEMAERGLNGQDVSRETLTFNWSMFYVGIVLGMAMLIVSAEVYNLWLR